MQEEARWGESTSWSVGAEEELMLVDADTLVLAPRSPEIVAAAEAELGPGRIKTELFACVVESNTGICPSADEAVTRLRELRAVAARLAEERGLRVFAAGAHPIGRPEEQEIVAEERYLAFVEYAGVSARRQGVNGLHVHVGMPDAQTCFHALEAVLPWLPVVLALSANSPYLSGEETGLASNRAEVLAQLPRSGAPPAFRDYEEWVAFVDRLVALGVIPDYTMLWWDIRPHPRFGTLEVRMPDQPTDPAASANLVALVRALCVAAAEGEAPRYDPPARALYQQNRWAALRAGLDAVLVHPDGDRMAPARELTRELSARVGVSLDIDRTEAEEQLAIGRADGLEALTAALVERTLR
ncbi:MAG TPA: YbdK family carboxylate-amine ligase [Gaiellaceae bacterium]|nr:YbdK family carboxylate-amine ligase [Gaiellaceae bacterium]